MGPKGKICFIMPLEETKDIYYCVMIKERILWGTDDKGVVKCCGRQGQATHLEVHGKDIWQNVYFKKIVLGVIYSKNDEN